MSTYQLALAAADPHRVRAAVSSADAMALMTEFGEISQAEAAEHAGSQTIADADSAVFAEAIVVEAARRAEAARAELDAALAQAASDSGNGQAAEAVAAAQAALTTALARLALAIEDAAGTAVVMHRGLLARHGGVQEQADAAGILSEREFHGQAQR
jgi:hypothetical protein